MKKSEPKKSKFQLFMAAVGELFKAEFATVTLDDGRSIEIDDETMEAFWLDDEGQRTEAVPDGTYTLSDDSEITIEDGKRVEASSEEEEVEASAEEEERLKLEEEKKEIEAKLAKLKTPEESPKEEPNVLMATIKEISKWEIEVDAEEITVGTKLKQVGFESETWTLNDGEYELENGDLIQVNSEGEVVLLTPKSEVAAGEESVEMSKEEVDKLKSDASEVKELKTKLASVEKTVKEQKAKIVELGKKTVGKTVEEEAAEASKSEEGKTTLRDRMVERAAEG